MPPIAIDPQALLQGLYSILPETLVVATALAVLFIDLILPEENKRVLCGASLVGIALSLFAVYAMGPARVSGFSGAVVHDGLGAFFEIVILSACALTLLMATGYSEWEGTHKGEFYSLLLLSTSGMMFMAKGTDLMTIFLGLETLSIPIYVLVGFHRGRMSSLEGAMTYFLLGAFASGVLLYGIALIYAATGSLYLKDVASYIASKSLLRSPMLLMSLVFLTIGFVFKVATVPFHMWTPDVYEGA